MRFRLFFVAGLLVALAAHSASAQRAAAPEAADLIVTNAQVTTLWPGRPTCTRHFPKAFTHFPLILSEDFSEGRERSVRT